MNALAKLDRVLPFVSQSARRDLLDVRDELLSLRLEVMRQSQAVIDTHRPQSLPDAPLYVGPSPVAPFAVSQENEE